MRNDDGLPPVQTTDLTRSLGEMRAVASGFSGDLSAITREMRLMDSETRKLSRALGTSLGRAFDKAVFGGDKLGDVLRDLARDVAGKALDAALRPVQNAIGSGVAGAVGSIGSSLVGAFGFADGGAFSAGRVRAFANGGVVDGPTVFPMRNGTGLMGEAGPEAILPLSRGPDGRLGVAAAGGGAAQSITVNISTPDIEGFRRSSGQVAAQIARAVGRGTGRL